MKYFSSLIEVDADRISHVELTPAKNRAELKLESGRQLGLDVVSINSCPEVNDWLVTFSPEREWVVPGGVFDQWFKKEMPSSFEYIAQMELDPEKQYVVFADPARINLDSLTSAIPGASIVPILRPPNRRISDCITFAQYPKEISASPLNIEEAEAALKEINS